VVTASEGDLVRAAKDGDAGAFEALLKPEYRTAFRLAFGMLHDIQEAEDAAQEAAFKAWRRIWYVGWDLADSAMYPGRVCSSPYSDNRDANCSSRSRLRSSESGLMSAMIFSRSSTSTEVHPAATTALARLFVSKA